MTSISIQAGRAPLADFNRWADSQIASYKSKIERNVPIAMEVSWIAHPVQKEAIQNSADAMEPASNNKWCVIFEMDNTLPPRYISITDQGTCGLTGKALVSKEELDRLLEEKPSEYQKERWAKFEALSYPNIDPVGRGSRGQGKWVFIGASKDKTIFYDTLRQDGVYRLGAWLGEKQLLQKPPEGANADVLLKKSFPYLNPLKKVGTRVIIVYPKKELWEGFIPILKSPIALYVEETWWELLRNGGEILIKWRGETVKVKSPIYYSDSFIQSQAKEIWSVEDVSLGWNKNQKTRVNELVIVYSEKVIPEEFRGIAIQRAGMKICNFDIKSGNPLIKTEIAEHVYGWIIFNEEAEKELREIEHPTHYDFGASVGTFGYHVFGKTGWLTQEVRKFAEQKLGLGLEAKKPDRLDIMVANRLNRFVNKYNLGLPLDRTSPGPGPGPGPRTRKKIRIKMLKPSFPREGIRRVEFGESIQNINVSVVNETKISRRVKLSLLLKTASRKVQERILKKFVASETIVVPSKSESSTFGPYAATFDKKKFAAGTYAIEAEIALLEGDILDDQFGKAVIVDQERELIYLDENPPTGKGLFEFIDRIEFKENKELQFRVKEKDGKMRIQINILHPAYKHNEELDDLLEEENLYAHRKLHRPLLDYEIGVGAEVIAQYDVRKEAKLVKEDKEKFILQRAEDKKAFFVEAVDQASRIAQRIRYEVL